MTDPDQESKCIVKKQTDEPVLDVQVFVLRVTHLTEARHEEVVAAMIRRRVLLDVRKLHKLNKEKTLRHFRAEQHWLIFNHQQIMCPPAEYHYYSFTGNSWSLSLHKHTRLHSQKHTFNWRNKLLQSYQILLPRVPTAGELTDNCGTFGKFSCFCLSAWLQHTVKNVYCHVRANLWLINAVNSQQYAVLNLYWYKWKLETHWIYSIITVMYCASLLWAC